MMKSNKSLQELGAILQGAKNVLIFPHVNPDGDALGSAIAICLAMRQSGKDAWVLMEEAMPPYLDFLNGSCCTEDVDIIAEPDLCICVDCSEEKRFPRRVEVFNKGRIKMCIDHHSTAEPLGDYYCIDGSRAATAEMVYRMLTATTLNITQEIAEHLYVGIVTDTGCFQYSNTTSYTHTIAAQLLEKNIDHMAIMVRLYQSVSRKRIELEKMVLQVMELICDGRGAMAYISQEMLKEAGAEADDAEGMIDILRNIEGVEIAGFLKERGDVVKASLRAKSNGRVDRIATAFGGGGHVKAAGCTIEMPLEEAVKALRTEIEKELAITKK